MTLDDVLGKIINHKMLVEEATHVKNLSNGITSSRKQDIDFKASKKSKSKKVVEESSSEEEKDDDSDDESIKYDPDEMALFIRRFSKMMSKKKFFEGDKKDKFITRTKRACYNCGKYGHYIVNCPHERRDEEDDKKKKERATRKISITRRKAKVRLTLVRSGARIMRVLTPIVMVLPPWQSRAPPLLQENLSSPTSTKGTILASWQRRVEER
jgi:hypothetical protein